MEWVRNLGSLLVLETWGSMLESSVLGPGKAVGHAVEVSWASPAVRDQEGEAVGVGLVLADSQSP